ncbi:GPALPP motifs-containing protein 1 [Haematobia irritans]|uniref:GPALPP motifs-containing protein 1 n=1 Tax=Haematobia irritans TaxID=7368 RepID=UPI003F4F80C4
MSSDTGSSSSTSEDERKRRQIKKLKKKSKKHKKEKKLRKEKKRSRKEEDVANIKPIAPPRNLDNTNEEVDSFGPALPPHLLNKKSDSQSIVIGPVMPKDFTNVEQTTNQDFSPKSSPQKMDSSEDEETTLIGSYGPIPIANDKEMSATQIELEKRALELKLATIDGINCPTNIDQTVREEWMLELPEVGLKGGLAALNNIKRGFHQGKEKPDFSDRSSWTKTPQSADGEKTKPSTSKESRESLKAQAQAFYDKQRDDEQEAMAKKHKKKHKREESLVDIHQKKLRKEEKRKAKELKESGAKPERRPFSRDIDLKLNKIDSHQTKQIVDKAKLLDTKFSRGHTKYL